MSFVELVSLSAAGGLIAGIILSEAGVLWRALVVRKREGKFSQGIGAWAVHATVVLLLGCMGWAYVIEPGWVEVTKVKIRTDKLKTSLRIVQFSDTHCDLKKLNEDKVVQIINSLEPDVVVFTGDTLNDARAAGNFKAMMGGIKSKLGKFAVKGNFESSCWANLDLWSRTGFRLLDGESAMVIKDGQELEIIGVDCVKGAAGFKLATSKERFTVFLDHWPDNVEEVAGKADLYLAGHTHGGQVSLPFYGAIITFSKFGKKYEAGRYEVGSTTLYVNRGIGMEGGRTPRIRFWARPEITLFEVNGN